MTRIPDLKLLKAGDALVLAGLDGDTVRWGRISPEGAISDEASFTLPARAKGPWFALAGNPTPANQLLAVFGAPRAADPTVFEIHVIAQTVGGMAGAPTLLYETVAGTDLNTIAFAVGSSPTGKRAALAVGFPSLPGTPAKVIFFGGTPAGGVSGPGAEVKTPDEWDCLALAQETKASPGSTTAVYWLRTKPTLADSKSPVIDVIHLADDATGASHAVNSGTVEIPKGVCPILSPTDTGYVFAWQTQQGNISIAPFDIASQSPPNSIFVDDVFENDRNPPKLVAVAGMGYNTAVLSAHRTEPRVRLWSAFGDEVGQKLILPSRKGEDIGPVSAVSAPDMMRLTYREAVKVSANTGPRHFVTVQCPVGS